MKEEEAELHKGDFKGDAWKNPKKRELKEEEAELHKGDFKGDAWKNPKKRELKGNERMFVEFAFALRCMEKSQEKGIERYKSQ